MVPNNILAKTYTAPSFPCHFHLCHLFCFTPAKYNAISHSIIALIAHTMASEDKRPYAVDKLYQNNLDQNVNGRKKTHGLTFTVTATPKRLKIGFTNNLDTKKKSTPAPSAPHATQSSTAVANAVTLVSSTKSVYNGNSSFTSAKRRAKRKRQTKKNPPSLQFLHLVPGIVESSTK